MTLPKCIKCGSLAVSNCHFGVMSRSTGLVMGLHKCSNDYCPNSNIFRTKDEWITANTPKERKINSVSMLEFEEGEG